MKKMTEKDQEKVDACMKKIFTEYGDTLRMLGESDSKPWLIKLEKLKDAVLRGRFGTKNRAELLMRLEDIIELL